MDKVNGYILLFKQIQDNPLWSDRPFARGQAWIDLLLLANFATGKIFTKGTLIEVERGQVFRTVKFLSDRWGWSIKKTKNFLKLLENEKMVTLKGMPQGTLITIEKYDVWQCQGSPKGTTDGLTEGYPRIIEERQKNKEKEERNKKDIYSDVPESIKPNFMDWVQMRKDKKKPIKTKRAVTMALNKLNSLTKNIEKQKELIDYAIFRNWESFYPIPEGDKIPKPKKEEVEEVPIDAVPMPEETKDKLSALGFGNIIGNAKE